MSTKLFCPLIFYRFYLWNHQSTQLQIWYCKTISSTKITFSDSETKSKKSKELYPGVCIPICVLNFGFSLGISLDVVMGRILRWPSKFSLPLCTDPSKSPGLWIWWISLLCLGCFMAQSMIIWMGWTGCHLLRDVAASMNWGEWLQLTASMEVGTSVPQPAVLDFCQQEWAWKQNFPPEPSDENSPHQFQLQAENPVTPC